MLHQSMDREMLAVVSQNARVRAGTTIGFNHLRRRLFFALAERPHVKHFVPSYRTHIVVFAGYVAHVCRYLSSNFITLAAGAGVFLQLSVVATCASRTLSKRRATCLLRSAYGERFSNHHRRNFASRHGDILRVSTALRLRDHFSIQDQMLKGCVARAAV